MTEPLDPHGTIFQVTTSRGWGGREQLPLAIHRCWLQQGRCARLLVGTGTELARHADTEKEVDLLPAGRLGFARALRGQVRWHDPTVILCHFTHDLPAIRVALAGWPRPRLVVIKHLSPGPPKLDFIHRFVYRRVDRLLAVSEFVRAKCLKSYPVDAARVGVWRPGVDVNRFSLRTDARARIRRSGGAGDDDYLIGYAARITPRKGIENLIEVMPRIQRQVPRARLWLIGGILDDEQPFLRQLRDQIKILGLENGVSFKGHQDRIEDYLCALDLFVTPSREESFGLTTVEAMAAGRPVVGFRAGGTAEIITDGRTGILADPFADPVADLTECILRLAINPDRAIQIGAAGREEAVRVFSQGAMMHRLDSELQSVVADPLSR